MKLYLMRINCLGNHGLKIIFMENSRYQENDAGKNRCWKQLSPGLKTMFTPGSVICPDPGLVSRGGGNGGAERREGRRR